MSVQIVNVGDGACTIVRGRGQSMVIDCGALHDDGKRSARRLADAVGASPTQLDTIVVSHFDADHWNGLEKLPDLITGSSLAVRLIYPRHPAAAAGLRQMLAAVLVTKSASPHGNAIKLQDAWKRSFPNTTKHALVRGDRFHAAGRTWSVHWPPLDVDKKWSKKFATVSAKVEKLAADNPDLRDALERAFSESEPEWDSLDNNGEDQSHEAWSDGNNYDFDELPDDERSDGEGQADDAPAPDEESETTDDLTAVYKDLQALNNSLSLVISDCADELVAFGDIEKWGLRRLLLSGGMPEFAIVVLAPHHGTQVPGESVRKLFPKSAVTVAQRGSQHERKASDKGYDRIWGSRTEQLHSTHSHGDYVIDYHWLRGTGDCCRFH